MVNASAREFFKRLWVKINPCEKDTTRQSIPNANARNTISTIFNLNSPLFQKVCSMGNYNSLLPEYPKEKRL